LQQDETEKPLIKQLYNNHQSSMPISTNDDTESVASGANTANKKVIKATITIPMPKADLGAFRVRNPALKT
jgi:hypothetical protein